MHLGLPPRAAAVLALSLAAALPAQDIARAASVSPDAPIPRDSTVVVGTLPNGLRYYIRANHRPEHRAELRLVVNAGSILEDSTQRGLAHFVEHMAFNGTRHFARQELVSYLESTGVRFGADLNASTSFDETVYRLTVPTDSARLLETGIAILEDWADGITFDSTELDRERGVVTEEWRLGRGAAQRIRDAQLPVLFAGSRYASRIPIGDPHTIATAPPAALERFYHEWYRPDLMAVVAVGDFDPARVEALVREHFAGIAEPPHALPRPSFPVPDHDSTLVSVVTDPEATNTAIAVYQLLPVERDSTVADYRRQLVTALYNGMLNARLDEIAQRPDAPFLGAYSAQGRLVRAKSAYVLSALVKNGGVARGLAALLTEAERVAQHGFTETELAREKRNLLREVEQAWAERDKTNSAAFVSAYVSNFLEGDAIPSVGQEWRLAQALVPGIRVEEVNALAREWLGDTSRVITASGPRADSASMPGAAALRALADSVARASVVAYVDSTAAGPLVAHPPVAGRVVAERRIDTLGVIEWTLSNGARVLLKPTNFKDDELLVSAFAPGGTSLAPDSLFTPARTATAVVEAGGLGTFSAVQLQKALAGTTVDVSPYIGTYDQGVSGGSSPKDAETLLQLIHLYFTSPRADTSAFESFKARMQAFVANRSASPSSAFADTVQVTLFRHHPRARPVTAATYDAMNLSRSLAFYRARFADASAFTFLFVGNVDTARLRPLVERYIASLPATHRAERWRDVGLRYARGVITRTVRRGSEPRSSTQLIFTGPFRFDRHDVYVLESLEDVLQIRLRDRLREQLGGTYGVGVSASATRRPIAEYELSISFGSAPERVTELVRATFAELDSIKRYGPTAADLQKVRETQLRERQTNVRRNAFWISALETYLVNGWNPRAILSFPDEVRGLDAAVIRDAARRYLDERNYVRVTLVPERPAS